jgi:hypothetical protein
VARFHGALSDFSEGEFMIPTPNPGREERITSGSAARQAAVYETLVLLTKPQLAQRLKVSPRTIDNMMAQRILPYIRASKRAVRFHWPRVLAALERREIREAGR